MENYVILRSRKQNELQYFLKVVLKIKTAAGFANKLGLLNISCPAFTKAATFSSCSSQRDTNWKLFSENASTFFFFTGFPVI